MANAALSHAANTALMSSVMYSQGALMLPRVQLEEWPAVRASVPSPLQQWVVQAENFEQTVLDQYRAIQPGEARLLVGATGVGKTTRMPLRIVQMTGKAGLVLLPDNLVLSSIVEYVKDLAQSFPGKTTTVDVLRSQYVKNPVSGSVLFYCSGADFLARLREDKKLIKRLKIDFVYLDEYHCSSGAYYFLRLFIEQGIFSGTKLFCGTATSEDTSMILTNARGEPRPMPIPEQMFVLTNPDALPSTSPAHYSRISRRTLLFLPSDALVDSWERYYDDHDVPVQTFHTYDGSTRLRDVKNKLKKAMPMVLLSSGPLDYGHTLDIDQCIDSGYTQQLAVNFSDGSLELVIRTVTDVERKQRIGRVNRHLPGTAYYVETALSLPESELSPTSAIYVWLWARLFNVQIKDPMISQYADIFGDYSDTAIALMLCSRVHPLLVRPYMTLDGQLYKGWHVLKSVFHTNIPLVISESSNDNVVSTWADRDSGPQYWLDEPVTYRCKVGFPDEWQALPIVAYMAYRSGRTNFGLAFDNRSVVSALVRDSTKPKSSMSRAVSVKSHADTVLTRPRSVVTVAKDLSPIGEDFSVPDVTEALGRAVVSSPTVVSSRTVVPTLHNTMHSRTLSGSSSTTIELPRSSSIDEWVAGTEKQTRHRRRSRRSDSSSGSNDKDMIMLEKVAPIVAKNYKLYPLDTVLLSQYLSQEASTSSDMTRFRELMRVKVNFANLSRDTLTRKELQGEYFLSVVKLHNSQVMERLQLKAGTLYKPQSFTQFLRKQDLDCDILIDQTARLIDGMQLEGYYVGVDVRSKHASFGTDADRDSYGRIERYRAMAQYYLHTANIEVIQEVERISSACAAVGPGVRAAGTFWRIGNALVMPAHVFSRVEIEFDFVLDRDDQKDFVVLKTSQGVTSFPSLRGPVDGEHAIAVGFDPVDKTYVQLGPFSVLQLDDVWCMTASFTNGYSGFAIISCEDMSFIGMYLGFYMSLGSESCGRFVPADSFASAVSKSFV